MMIKLDMGSTTFRDIDFLYQKSVQRIWDLIRNSDRLEIFWPAKLGKYWRWIDTLRKSNMARGDPPKKKGCWWSETYLGGGTIEYSLFEPPIHAEIQYFTRVSSFCFFGERIVEAAHFRLWVQNGPNNFRQKLYRGNTMSGKTSQAFLFFPSVFARRPYHYFPSGKDVVQRSRFWRVLSSFFVHQSQRMHENACLAIILCIYIYICIHT